MQTKQQSYCQADNERTSTLPCSCRLVLGDQQADSTPMPNPFGDFLESVPQLSPKSPTLTADLLEQWLVARAWLRWRRSSSSIFRLIGSCTVHPVHVAEGSEEKTDLRTEAASGKIRRPMLIKCSMEIAWLVSCLDGKLTPVDPS